MAFKHPADGIPKKKVPPRPKRFKCSQCEYRAASKVIVAKHFRARHTEFGKYKCKECPYITSQKPNLDFHYKVNISRFIYTQPTQLSFGTSATSFGKCQSRLTCFPVSRLAVASALGRLILNATANRETGQ